MTTTYEARLVAGILAYGWNEDHNDRSKYRAFVKAGTHGKLFVGRAGALRAGECATRSHSIGDPQSKTSTYLKVLAKGDVAMGAVQAVPEAVAA